MHFDGHGAYFDALCFENAVAGLTVPSAPSPHTYSPVGHLHFELLETGESLAEPELIRRSAVRAEDIAGVLREAGVPTVVLNACQSAMLDRAAEDPFAAVAVALLQAGVRNVVAMAYSLYVSGAQVFLPAFYRDLFHTGDVAAAVRAGRQAMRFNPQRVCARGTFPLQDWLVPVLYQQDPFDFGFARAARPPEMKNVDPGVEADGARTPYGFIGRDGSLLELERSLRRPSPAVLICGLGGVGKTTLARGFVGWLAATNGLELDPIWIDFRDVYSAEYLINRMGEPVLVAQFAAAPMNQKLPALSRKLREQPVLVVWDNFEVAAGIEGTSVTANLPPEDRRMLATLLDELRGGRTKVLITSRSQEDWLGPLRRFLLPLRGLEGEERWQFFAAVLSDLGRKVDRADPEQVELMRLLGGHPLAMQVILPRLERESARSLIDTLRANTASFSGADPAQEQLFGALRVPLDALPPDLRGLLMPLALHEAYAETRLLATMADQVEDGPNRMAIDRFATGLATAGLVRDLGHGILELHPMLTGYLRGRLTVGVPENQGEAWTRAFVDVMSKLADVYGSKELHEQRTVFHLHSANFHHARNLAERLDMRFHFAALTVSLAAFAHNTCDFEDARRLSESLADHRHTRDNKEWQARAFHQLGVIAQQRRDFAGAVKWYRKSLAIKENLGIEDGAALTYHQLATIAHEQRDFKSAEEWCRKSLAIMEKLHDERGTARAYFQLGRIAEAQRDFSGAEQRYRKCLAIDRKHGNEQSVAGVCHQMGWVAQQQLDFAAAKRWYRKAVALFEHFNIQQHADAAGTYHHLGMIAHEEGDFTAAEAWYHKALTIFERLGMEHFVARSSHELGRVAQRQGDFAVAETWYHKSLAIQERLGEDHHVAMICGQLGTLAVRQGAYEEAASWLVRCITGFAACNDPEEAAHGAHNFAIFYRQADTDTQAKLAATWTESGLGPLPEVNE